MNFKRKKKKERKVGTWSIQGYFERQGRSKGGKRKRSNVEVGAE